MGQRDFVNRLLAAQTDVQDAREALKIRVAGAKSAILNRITPSSIQQSVEEHQVDINPYAFQDAGNIDPYDLQQSVESQRDVRDDILEEAFISPLQPESPVIGKTKRGANIHADGSYSVVTPDGKIHAGLTHEQADRYSVYSKQEVIEEATDVPEGFIGRKATGIKDQTVDVVKGLVQGPIIGATSLEEAVNDRNAEIKTQQEIVEMGVPTGVIPSMDPFFKYDYVTPPKPPITPEQIKQYEKVKDSVVPETATPLFKELAELEESAKANKARFEFTEKVATKLKEIFPASYKDQMAAKAGFDAVAEDKGTWEAIKYTFDNDLGTLLSAGIDSTPWMVAYTIGGPLTQTAIITSLARSKGRQAIEEFKIVEGRNPDAIETQRIKLWSAIGSVAEKYGDLSALRAFKGNLPFLKNVSKALAANTTAKVLSLPTIAALRVGTALGGEALSGGITSYSEQMAEHGKVTDPATIAYDALAEAAGTPGGIATMAAGKLTLDVGEGYLKRPGVRKETMETQLRDSELLLERVENGTITAADVALGPTQADTLREELANIEVPLITDESQIEVDENGYAKPTNSKVFNKEYNRQLTEGGMTVDHEDGKGPQKTGLNWEDALKATQLEMDIARDELNIGVTQKNQRNIKGKLKRNIKILKTDLEEEKLGWTDERKRKEALKAKYEKRSYKFKKQKEEEAEVEAAENEAEAVKIYNRQRTEEIDETIDKIKKNKTASNESKVKSLQNLQDSKELPLKGYQKVRIKRLLRKYAPVEVDETADTKTFLGALKKIFKGKTKEEESLSSLQELSDPTDDNEKEHKDIIEDLESGKLTKLDKLVLDAHKELRKHFNKIKDIGRHKKTQVQVNEEIISGTARGYKGFSTFREEIIKRLEANKKANSNAIRRNQTAIDHQLAGMKQHLENLKNKLKAFNEAKNAKPKKKGNIVVVKGTKDTDKSGGAIRWMDYTLVEMTKEEYIDGRENKGQFLNRITNKSGKLLTQIQDEINYGEQAVFIAENHGSTSFFKAAAQRAEQLKKDEALAQQIAALEGQVDLDVEDITEEDIESIDIDDTTTTTTPGTPTTPVKPIYANQTFEDLNKELIRVNIDIVDLGSLGVKRTAKQDIEYKILINTQKDIQHALTNTSPGTTPTPTTTPVTETTPTEVEETQEEVSETETPSDVEGASIEDVLNFEDPHSGLVAILDPGQNTTEMLEEKIKSLEHLITYGETLKGKKIKDDKRGTVAEQTARFRVNLTAARLQLKYSQRQDTGYGTGITPDMIRHMTVLLNKAKEKLSKTKKGSEEHSKLKAEISEIEGSIQKLFKEDPDLANDLRVTQEEVVETEVEEETPAPPKFGLDKKALIEWFSDSTDDGTLKDIKAYFEDTDSKGYKYRNKLSQVQKEVLWLLLEENELDPNLAEDTLIEIIEDPSKGDLVIADLMDQLPEDRVDKDNLNRVRDWRPFYTSQGNLGVPEQWRDYTIDEQIAAVKVLQGDYAPAFYEHPDQLKLGFDKREPKKGDLARQKRPDMTRGTSDIAVVGIVGNYQKEYAEIVDIRTDEAGRAVSVSFKGSTAFRTYVPIDQIEFKPTKETKAPTTPIISKMREVVDLITADDFNGQEWINSFHGKIIESIGKFSIPKLKSMILARKESEAYDTYLRFLEIELEYRNAGGVKGGPLSPESLATLRWNIDFLAFDIEGYDPVTKTTRFDDRENKIEFDISAAKQKLKRLENDLKIRIDKALALVEDPANRTEDSAEKAAKAERERTIDERIAKAQEPLDKAVAKLKDAMPGSNKRAWIYEVTLLLDKVNAVRKKFKREPLPFPVKDKTRKEKLKIWNDAIKSLSKEEINTLNKYLNYSGKKKEFTKEDFVDFMLHPSSKKIANTMAMNNPDGSVEFTKLGIASGAKAAAEFLFPALKIVQKLRQERIANEIPTVEGQTTVTAEGQSVEGQPPVSETTPPVTEPSTSDTTQDGDTGQEGPVKRIPLLSRTKQAFRTVFPQIITKEGTLVEEEELEKHSKLVGELAEELGVPAGYYRLPGVHVDEDGEIIQKGDYEGIIDALEELPDAKNFIEEAVGYDVDPPKIATEKQLETALGEALQKAKEKATDAFEKAVDVAIHLTHLPKNFLKRTAEAQKKILALHNRKYKYISSKKEREAKLKTVEERKLARPETILGIVGKTFKDLVTMTTKKGIQTIPNFVFDDKQLLTQALLDLLPDSETKETTVKELVDTYRKYKAKYEKIKWDANEVIDEESGNFADQPLSLLHLYSTETDTNQLPNAVVFMMMLATTNFVHQRSSRGNQPFVYNSEMEDFLYSGLEELSDEEREQLDSLGYNYRLSSNQIGTQIVKTLKFKSKLAPEYYDKLKTALGMLALQVDHGIFDFRTADKSFKTPDGKIGSPLSESDKESAKPNPTAPFQIETYTWNFEDPFKENRNRNNPIKKKADGTFTATIDGQIVIITKAQARALNLRDSVSGEYKHIRLNPAGSKIDEAGATALAEINKALKLGLEEEQPLQEPELEVNKRIRNSIGKIANKIIKTVTSQQKDVSWTGTESMSIVSLLANSGDKSRKIIDKQLGVDEAANDEDTHQAKRKSLTSKNRTTLANFNNALRAFNSGTLKRFYVKYRLQNQLRYLMEGPVNPQQDKNIRYLVKPFETTEFNEKNIHLFKLAAAFNFGIKVDKHNLPYVIKQFDAITKDPKVLAAVQLLNKINKIKDKFPDHEDLLSKLNKDGLLDQFADSLVPLNGAYSTNIALIGGLTALSRYMTVTGKRDDQKGPQEGFRKTTNSTFESDVPLEIDGISNGFMINILQFPNFQKHGDLTELIDLLSKVGMYPGKDPDNVTHNVYAPDSYQSLAMLMAKYTDLDNTDVKTYIVDNELMVSPQETNALHALYKDLVDKSGNLELLRDLVKYPFLIYLYGGGIKSISEGVGKKIYKDLIDQLDRQQKDYNAIVYKTIIDEKGNEKRIKNTDKDQVKKYNEELWAKASLDAAETFIEKTWTPFLTNLITIGALGNNPETLTKRLRENKTQTLTLREKDIIQNIGRILRPRLDLSLSEMLGVTTESRNAVIKAGELLNAMFIVKFERIYNAHLKKTGREYLTEKEVNEFIRATPELNDYYPEYQVPLATEGETATIDLTKRRQTNKEDRVGEVEISYFSVITGQKKVNRATTRTFEFELPGPAALTRSIMNVDSSAMTKLLAIHKNILGLHDGIMGDPITLLKSAGTYGNVVRDLNFENSILHNINELVQKRWSDLGRTDEGKKDQKAINEWIQENGYDNQLRIDRGETPLTSDQILDIVHEANEANNEHRDNLKEMSEEEGNILQGILHMYMPVQPLKRIKEIVAKLGLTDFKFKPTDPKLTQEQKDKYAELLENSEDTVTLKNGEKPPPKTKGEQDLEEEIYTTLRDLPRTNEKTVFNKGISRGTIKILLKKLKAHSANYYNSATEQTVHSAFLEDLIDVIEDGLGDVSRINLLFEKIDGVTQGEFLAESKVIRVSMSRQGPQSANSQSPQEAYAHELLHFMTFFALKDEPRLREKLQQIYNKVRKSITEEAFLPKGREPTESDYALAHKEYTFIFQNEDNADHTLDEFLAYGLTNQALINFLIDFPISKREGWLGQLLDLFEKIVVAFGNALGVKALQSTKSTAYAEMFAIAERLIAIQNKHESILIKKERKLYKNLDTGDRIFRNLVKKILDFTLRSETLKASKLGRVVRAGVVPVYMFLSNNAVSMRAKSAAMEMLNQTARAVLNEVSEAGTLNKDYIDQLLKIRGLIAKAQWQIERYTYDWFNGSKEIDQPSIWKSLDVTKPHAMSVNTREALTSVFYRTDLSSLLVLGLSHFDIGNLVNNDTAIQTQKTRILKQLGLSVSDDVIKYTNNLGYWMSTGLNKLHGAHTNVRSIAQTYNITDEKHIDLLSAYATLSALVSVQITEKSGVNQEGLDAVKKLINDEFKADSKENAIIDILDTHLDYVDKATKNLFDKNINQMVKGYIVERVDDLTQLETGLLKDKKAWWLKGFRHHEQLVGVQGIDNHHDTLYIAYNSPEQKDQSGLIPSTNQKHMGTTLTEILSKNPKYQTDGQPDYGKINSEIKKIKKREEAAPVIESKKDVQLMPLRDDDQNTVDYRVMLSHAATKKILKPDLEIQNVFGHMRSSYIDRKYSLVEGKHTIDLVIDERNNMLDEDNRHLFIDLISPESGYIDRYRKLPKALREYILEYLDENGEFLVREDVVNKVFGYKPIHFSNVSFLQGPGPYTQAAKHAVNNFHTIAKEFAGYGKDRIVIAMPAVVIGNLLSNIFRLSMAKIPQSYIYPKIDEGVREFFRYRELQRQRFNLQTLVDSRKLGSNSPQAKELKIVISKIKRNAIHELSEAGVNSIIVEDLNEAQIDGYINRIRRLFKSDRAAHYLTKVPPTILEVASWIYWTKGVKGYKYMRTIVQLTDFIARYVMVSYDKDVKKMPFSAAKHKALDSFVLFDEALAPLLEMVDVVGGTSFIAYFLRNQRDNTQLIKSSPTSVGVSAVIQNVTGIPTLGNLNAGWVSGDIEPNLFQFDDLIDEATKATGFEIVSYFGDIIDEIID